MKIFGFFYYRFFSTGYRPIADAVRALSHDENNGKRKEIADATTPLLPSAMRDAGVDSTLHLRGARSEWFAPRTLDELLALRQEYPDARIVVGNTEVGVEQRFKVCLSKFIIVFLLLFEYV